MAPFAVSSATAHWKDRRHLSSVDPRHLRILVIASEVPPVTSGLARSVGALMRGLSERGHEVVAISGADARGLKWDRLRFSLMHRTVRETLDSHEPFDVVNVHGPSPSVSDLAMLMLRRQAGKSPAVVYTHHFSVHFNVPLVDQLASLYERATRQLARRCDAVVTTTPSYASTFPRSKVRVIGWAVDSVGPSREAAVRRYDGSRPLRVLCVGQFRRYKGFDVAVKAVAGVEGLHLNLVGKGPRLAQVKAAAAGASNVCFLGALSDDELAAAYRDNDVVLLPSTSRLEAFGLVLLEGMAHGCVPVASRLPGVTDVVGRVGLTTTPGDAASLRSTLLHLAGAPDEVLERRKLALDAVADYTWDDTVTEYERVFRHVVQERPLE